MSRAQLPIVLVGNPRPGSRTAALASALATQVFGEHLVLDLADLVAIGLTTQPVAPRTPRPDALELLASADRLVVATPSYKGSYSGLLKVYLDQLAAGALAGGTALALAVAGSPAHAETTAEHLARLLEELGATVVARLAVTESQLNQVSALATQLAGTVAPVAAPELSSVSRASASS
jgi:FMN reductase